MGGARQPSNPTIPGPSASKCSHYPCSAHPPLCQAPALLNWAEDASVRVSRLNTVAEAQRAAEAIMLRFRELSVVVVTSIVVTIVSASHRQIERTHCL